MSWPQAADPLAREALAVCECAPLLRRVEAIYRHADALIAARGPICRQCGLCCAFERAGHELFVSTVEAAYLLHWVRIDRVARVEGRTCPFLRTNPARCGARTVRPLGCRIYSCHPRARRWQAQLYARLHGRLRTLHQRLGVGYFYAQWLAVLRAAAARAA